MNKNKRKAFWSNFILFTMLVQAICILLFVPLLVETRDTALIIGSWIGLFIPLTTLILALIYLFWSAIFEWREVNLLKQEKMIQELKEEDNEKNNSDRPSV